MKIKNKAVVDISRCVSCGECMWICPTGAMKIIDGCYSEANKIKCVGCGLCIRNCPVGCIKLEKVETNV